MGFIEGFRQGMSGDSSYTIAGRKLVCPHCGGDQFDRREAQLNTRALTFLGLDWADARADAYECTRCGHLEFFVDR